MKIVLTGTMNMTREQETRRFQAYGITVMKAVSKNVDYLIKGIAPGWNKLNAAKNKGIPIMTEEDFFDMLLTEFPEVLL